MNACSYTKQEKEKKRYIFLWEDETIFTDQVCIETCFSNCPGVLFQFNNTLVSYISTILYKNGPSCSRNCVAQAQERRAMGR